MPPAGTAGGAGPALCPWAHECAVPCHGLKVLKLFGCLAEVCCACRLVGSACFLTLYLRQTRWGHLTGRAVPWSVQWAGWLAGPPVLGTAWSGPVETPMFMGPASVQSVCDGDWLAAVWQRWAYQSQVTMSDLHLLFPLRVN